MIFSWAVWLGDGVAFSETLTMLTSPLKDPAAMIAGLSGWQLTHIKQLVREGYAGTPGQGSQHRLLHNEHTLYQLFLFVSIPATMCTYTFPPTTAPAGLPLKC